VLDYITIFYDECQTKNSSLQFYSLYLIIKSNEMIERNPVYGMF
jgi:hypothetical protein